MPCDAALSIPVCPDFGQYSMTFTTVTVRNECVTRSLLICIIFVHLLADSVPRLSRQGSKLTDGFPVLRSMLTRSSPEPLGRLTG